MRRLDPELVLHLNAILERFPEPTMIVGADRRILGANRRFASRVGAVRAVGRHCYEIIHHNESPCSDAERCPLRGCQANHRPFRARHLHWGPRKGIWEIVIARPILDEGGGITSVLAVFHAAERRREAAATPAMVGRSLAFENLQVLIRRIARSDVPVLLQGEPGTGKRLAARKLHEWSHRSDQRFISIDGTGLTERSFEREILGHEDETLARPRGDLLGPLQLERAGTLLLEGPGSLSRELQDKLFRIVEAGAYRSMDRSAEFPLDFRLVTTTTSNLGRLVAQRRFREDLFYLVSTLTITLPPLRERLEDLRPLIRSLLERIADADHLRVDERTLEALRDYSFPGNITELRQILEHASLMTEGDIILTEHLPETVSSRNLPYGERRFTTGIETLPRVKQRYLCRVAENFSGTRAELASHLGVSERTLYRLLRRAR